MSEQRGSEPILPDDDFRARRDYLPDDAFGYVSGPYEGATDRISEDEWHKLMSLPTDTLLRTTDQFGPQLTQLRLLWERWLEELPPTADMAPFMFNAGWDAADDFNASTFTLAHGYYRQSMAGLRSVIDRLAIAAGFGAWQDAEGLRRWLSGESDAPKFGNARDAIAVSLGTDATAVLNTFQKELSGYIHSQASTASAMLWAGSNGPVLEHDSFVLVYGYFRDVMAMALVLLSIGWSGYSIPDELWPLFERPNGGWATVSLPDFKRHLAGGDGGK